MAKPLRLGIAGLGTVGVGVVRILRKHAALLEARTGRPLVITAVSARSHNTVSYTHLTLPTKA